MTETIEPTTLPASLRATVRLDTDAFASGCDAQVRFAKQAQAEQAAVHEGTIDTWFATWNAANSNPRKQQADLTVWGADYRPSASHMPGVRLVRVGTVRYLRATALVDWHGLRGDNVVMAGTNAFELSCDGQIVRAAGIPS